ncbi:MAG: BamA/TamA family outer membrane protein [Cyclobacteriaceae bacterium]
MATSKDGTSSDPPPLNSNPANNGYFDYRFERPGQLLIEGSVEWRQKLIGFLNYAFFIDAGNVWAVQTNSNANASFAWDKFYKEFGIGTGLGLRFDFTFLILRFDVGIKAWDPARPVGSRLYQTLALNGHTFITSLWSTTLELGILSKSEVQQLL